MATERMFAEPSILETIASVSQALHQNKRAGGFAPPTALEAADAVLEAPAAGTESVADAPTPPPVSESQEVSFPQPAEAAETTAAAATTSATQGVVGEVGSSSSRSVAVCADDVRVLDELAAVLQERVTPENTTRVASPRIQEAEEMAGATLLQGPTSGEA
jgi:hypothetical protein